MSTNKTITLISALLLRIGVVLFIFSQLFDIASGIQSGSEFWDYFLEIILMLIFVGLSIIILALEKPQFEVFGFFLVMLGSLYAIVSILITKGIRSELCLHFLLIAVSIYFILKSRRGNRKRAVNVFE
jgi:hypothetical protein